MRPAAVSSFGVSTWLKKADGKELFVHMQSNTGWPWFGSVRSGSVRVKTVPVHAGSGSHRFTNNN